MEFIRTFIAIDLPADLLDQILKLQHDLTPFTNSFLRWTRPENIHLTLKFLGNVEKQKLDELIKTVQEISRAESSFTLFITSLGVFPNLKQPRIVWVGINQNESLTTLVQHLEGKLANLGFATENRPFKPHLTIGRVRSYCTSNDSQMLSHALNSARKLTASFLVNEIVLYKSDLRPEGPVYSRIITGNFYAGK